MSKKHNYANYKSVTILKSVRSPRDYINLRDKLRPIKLTSLYNTKFKLESVEVLLFSTVTKSNMTVKHNFYSII